MYIFDVSDKGELIGESPFVWATCPSALKRSRAMAERIVLEFKGKKKNEN